MLDTARSLRSIWYTRRFGSRRYSSLQVIILVDFVAFYFGISGPEFGPNRLLTQLA